MVPDEPLHLSGVMVVLGVVLGVAAFVAGSLQVLKSTDSQVRSSGKRLMVASALTLVGTAAVMLARLMAQFG